MRAQLATKARMPQRTAKTSKAMPFVSASQMRAAFGGYLGSEMKRKAPEWAKETPNPKALPAHVGKKRPAIPNVKHVKSL
jgi:hypothetical protein